MMEQKLSDLVQQQTVLLNKLCQTNSDDSSQNGEQSGDVHRKKDESEDD